ncbi:caspase family protein [Aliarcobacter skirrowii]|uniref:caspase family protein n=1 Tax=Aliarcobacter skirrowii TaxID=28200 RepID=UPI0029A4BFF2|nr:caspase family protein [Aliarcobacter skirrowii]MDX4061090.1 caspase family protein [Aliarcobacter skirrowii]
MKKLLLILTSLFLFYGCSTIKSKSNIKYEEKLSSLDIKWDGNINLDKTKCHELDKTTDIKYNPDCLDKNINGHNKDVNSIAISSDNKYIVSGSHDATVKLWEINSGKLLKTFTGHNLGVLSVAISSDNKYIVSGSLDNRIKLWEINSGKLLKTFTGHKSIVKSVAISSDSKYIVSGGDDNRIKLWEINSGKLLKTFTGHNRSVYSVVISSDNKYIVSGSQDATVKLWEINSGKLLKTFTGHQGAVYSVAISRDGRYLVSGSWDYGVKLWEINSGKILKTLTGHRSGVLSVAIRNDNKYIVSGGWDNTVKLWEINNGELLETLTGNRYGVRSVAISNDNKYIVYGNGDNTIKIYNNISNKYNFQDNSKIVKKYNFKDISNLVQKSLDDYLTLPLVTTSLPPQEDLVKSQFETKKEFEQRVENTRAKREKEIEQLQDKYRKDVELRNKKLEERRANVENMRLEFMRNHINTFFGKLILKSLTYDAETQTAFGEIYGETSSFSEKISFKIDPNSAKRLFENPNMSNHSIIFNFDDNNRLYIKKINISDGFENSYSATLTDKSYKPEIVKVALSDKKLENIVQNPNLIDRYETKIVEFKGDRKDDLASMVAKMKQAPIDNKKWLFVFAVENYDETDKVVYAKNSAEIFTQAMQKRLGISQRNSYVYIDNKATTTVLSDQLDRFLKNVKQGDSVYFYYSGHGIPDPKTGEAYLLPKDKIVDYVTKEDNLKAKNIYYKLSNSNASQVVAFVDSCFSGKTDNIANYKGVAAGLFRTKKIDFNQNKMTVLTAGTNNQFSNAHPQKPHRLFSYYLVETMAKEDKLDLDLLYSKVYTKVKDVSWNMGDVYQQEPTKEGKINLEF